MKTAIKKSRPCALDEEYNHVLLDNGEYCVTDRWGKIVCIIKRGVDGLSPGDSAHAIANALNFCEGVKDRSK